MRSLVTVFINTNLRIMTFSRGINIKSKGEMSYILNDCGAKVAIIEEDNFPIFQTIRDQVPVESALKGSW